MIRYNEHNKKYVIGHLLNENGYRVFFGKRVLLGYIRI